MVDPTHLEKAVLTIITGVSIDGWVPFTMGELRNRLNEFDHAFGASSDGEMLDCVCSLESQSLIAIQKFENASFIPFPRARSSDDHYRHHFFGIGSFELKITHEGRKVVAPKAISAQADTEPKSSADEMDDRLPLHRAKVFDADLERYVKEAIESGFPLSLVMIDVDKFKQVNDTHGHPIGDDLLLAIATTIANRARGKGKAYRYGRGDEMAILLPNYSKMEAAALAETIRIEFERSRITDKKLTVTASFGVAAVPEDAQVGKDLLNLADSSLLSAKKLGRNLVRAVGDVDEPKESPAPRRKQPTSEALSGEQEAAIRTTYFRGRTPECPKDGALLRVTEFKEVGFKTPSLLVNCPGCGLQVHIRGV